MIRLFLSIIYFAFVSSVFLYCPYVFSSSQNGSFKKDLLPSGLLPSKLSLMFHILQTRSYKKPTNRRQDLIKKIIDSLDHPNPQLREKALFQMLNLIGPNTHLLNKKISLLLWDSDSDVRLMAVVALKMSGSTHWSVIKSFAKALLDSNFKVRHYALMSLTNLFTKNQFLLTSTFDDLNISKTLIELANALKTLVDSENRYVRLTSADLYRKITGYSFLNTLNVEENYKIQQLVKSLNSVHVNHRVEAVRALEPYVDQPTINFLINDMLLDSDTDVQFFATRAFGKKSISDFKVATTIGKNMMSSPKPEVRLESVQAVMNQPTLPMEPLQVALSAAAVYDSNEHVRHLAVRALGKIYLSYKNYEGTILYGLIKSLSDISEPVRRSTVYILEQKLTSNSEVISALYKSATQDKSSVVRNWAMLAFQKLDRNLVTKDNTCKKVFSH